MGAVYATLTTEVVISGIFLWHLRGELGQIIDLRGFAGPLTAVGTALGTGIIFKDLNSWLLLGLCTLFYVGTIAAVDRSAICWLYRVVTSREP